MLQNLEVRKHWHKPENLVTLFRLVTAWVPAAFILLSPEGSGGWWVAAVAFVIVAATDALDGYIARKRAEFTKLGKFLDPLVDKILVALTLGALCLVTPILWLPTGFIFLREIWVTLALRGPAQKAGEVIAAVASGKWKMAFQCAMIVALIIPGGDVWLGVQITLVVQTMLVTGWSWYDYHKKFGGKG